MVCLLIGLSASTVRWLTKLYYSGKYPYSGVKVVKDGKLVNLIYSDTSITGERILGIDHMPWLCMLRKYMA